MNFNQGRCCAAVAVQIAAHAVSQQVQEVPRHLEDEGEEHQAPLVSYLMLLNPSRLVQVNGSNHEGITDPERQLAVATLLSRICVERQD